MPRVSCTSPSGFRLRSATEATGVYEPLKSLCRNWRTEDHKKKHRKKSFLQWNRKVSPVRKKRKREGTRADRTWNRDAAKIWARSAKRIEILRANPPSANEWGAKRPRMRRCRACSRGGMCGVLHAGCCTTGGGGGMIRRREITIYLVHANGHRAQPRTCWYARVLAPQCSLSGTVPLQCGHCFSAAGYPGLSHQHGHGSAGG